MKIKLSKIMAAVTALGVTFAGFSAMAANVTTTTTYMYGADATATVAVKTVIDGFADAENGKEITYYVSTKDANYQANEGILYIDQQTVTGNKVEFSFSGVAQAALYNVQTTAKNGSDISAWDVDDYSFTFNTGANYITNATANVTLSSAGYTYIKDDGVTNGTINKGENDNNDGITGIAFIGKVVGNPSEYGVQIGETKYPALGCDDQGNFVIVISGDDNITAETVATPYPVAAVQ